MSKNKKGNDVLKVLGVLALGGIIFGLREAVVEVGAYESDLNDDDAIKAGLQDVIDTYGENYARSIEQMLRWESAHFKSGQWKEGNTAGMEATSANFPYGWSSLLEWATIANLPANRFGTYTMRENGTGIIKTFIRFPNVRSFINFLAWFIKNKRGGRPGFWYSLNEASARNYEQSIAGVVPRFVNSLA